MPFEWVELAGYGAAALVFATFCMRTMLPLRLTAIASNLAFIAYGALGDLRPILLLHAVLLPVNVWRTVELWRLLRRVRRIADGDLSPDWLRAYMKSIVVAPGRRLFAKGDRADKLYIVVRGAVLIEEVGTILRDGALFGEIGLFAADRTRSKSAVCVERTELLWIDETELALLCHDNPAMAFHMLRLITNRLVGNEARLEAALAARQGGMVQGGRLTG